MKPWRLSRTGTPVASRPEESDFQDLPGYFGFFVRLLDFTCLGEYGGGINSPFPYYIGEQGQTHSQPQTHAMGRRPRCEGP